MAQDILLEAKNLVKDYKEGKIVTSVLKGVNLSIQENELVSVVGSSGSGKSTLLHILGTLDTQTSGEVLFRGEDLSKLSQKKLSEFRSKNLGFVYQFHHLLSDFTAYENVAIPLMINNCNKKEIDERVKYCLDKVGLYNRAKHKSSELSGGERQRIAIARAIVNNPSLILADEPTGNLDHKTAMNVFDLLLELREQNKCSLVVVTHDNELASRFDRKIMMKDGIIG
ncbi:MAG: lipoprotein-releasing ABC transporter ATP-binding protein LolD [Ruminobacter sp.]|nr:lipoprotein-releasing ABC transporter ATP-binding protein LolD [Ruminobacter sp.]